MLRFGKTKVAKVVRPVVLTLSTISVHFKTFKNKDGYKDKKNNKLMSFRIDNDNNDKLYDKL